jgi:hypothetical protein
VVSVDSTVVRTSGDQAIAGAKTFSAGVIASSDLTVEGQVYLPPDSLAASGTVNIDFGGAAAKDQGPLTGNVTYTGSNYAAGASVTVRVVNGGTLRTLAFPSGWVFVGEKPDDIGASKTGILTVTSFGTVEGDCVAAWAVEA